MTRNYWQIAAGAKGRDYSRSFYDTGLAFVGGDRSISRMREVKPGDVLVLKSGLSQILAAGEVVEREGRHSGEFDKQWLRDFDGWDLPAYCYVRWHVPSEIVKTSGLQQGTLFRLPKPEHRDIANQLLQLDPWKESGGEPAPTREVSDQQILETLIEHGLRPAAADELTNTLRRIRLLADYYLENCPRENVREHEARSFLILPFLLSLGWSEQQIKVEIPASGGRADIACFSQPYHKTPRTCALILESKGFAFGLEYAPKQAQRYALDPDLSASRVLVVSNGFCYKSYVRDPGEPFPDRPTAYLNITKPQDRYPLDPVNVGGALDLLKSLLPE